jgi:hypothetical protein
MKYCVVKKLWKSNTFKVDDSDNERVNKSKRLNYCFRTDFGLKYMTCPY